MSLTGEQEKHLRECWTASHLRMNELAEARERELVGAANAKHNSTAIAIAYKDAALEKLQAVVQSQIDMSLKVIGELHIVVDDSVERFVLNHIEGFTSAMSPLQFPPGLRDTGHLSAVQGSYVRERQKLASKLYREAANAIRTLKLRPIITPENHSQTVQTIVNVTGSNAHSGDSASDRTNGNKTGRGNAWIGFVAAIIAALIGAGALLFHTKEQHDNTLPHEQSTPVEDRKGVVPIPTVVAPSDTQENNKTTTSGQIAPLITGEEASDVKITPEAENHCRGFNTKEWGFNSQEAILLNSGDSHQYSVELSLTNKSKETKFVGFNGRGSIMDNTHNRLSLVPTNLLLIRARNGGSRVDPGGTLGIDMLSDSTRAVAGTEIESYSMLFFVTTALDSEHPQQQDGVPFTCSSLPIKK